MIQQFLIAALSGVLWNMPLLRAVEEPVVLPVTHDHLFGSGRGQLNIDAQAVVSQR